MDQQDMKLRRQPTQHECQKTFVRDDHLVEKNFLQRINWLNLIIVFGVPLMAIYGLLTTNKHYYQTWIFAILYYIWSGLGITAGYHRYFSHRAYDAHPILEIWLLLGGAGALQGSCKWWSLLHRAHHRFTDTDNDPYNAQRGFWYAHFGWLLYDSIHVNAQIEIDDLKCNKLVRFQHNQYAWLGPFMSLIFPVLVCGLGWGDYRGGLYIGGFFRVLFIQHATWCVNSVAHWFGNFTFDDTISPRDSIFTSLVTFGEGYHNFHHEFPNDYRNGTHWYDYDPTKWFIALMYKLGLAYNLIAFPMNEIKRGEIDMKQKKLNDIKSNIDYGISISSLPHWNLIDIQKKIKQGKILIIVENIVHDVTDFLKENKHPGGKKVMIERNGKDATKDFNGGVYNHTNAARNLMSHMRVAVYDRN